MTSAAVSRCLVLLASLTLGVGALLHAQQTASIFDNQRVIEAAQKLEARLHAGAEPTGLLEEEFNATTRVAVRVKSGRAEFHHDAADVFDVLSGDATLVSGGTIQNPQGSGEIRGDSIQGGTSSAMHKGDVVYIPPATPHQVMVQQGTTFKYVLVKVPAAQPTR